MNPLDPLTDSIHQAAEDEGFVLWGVAPAIDSTGHADLVRWIDAGYAGQMQYFADRVDAYRHPRGVLTGAKSVVVLAFPYPARSHHDTAIGHGKVARYAWSGIDYHDVIHPKLKRVCRIISDTSPDANARGIVDTAPLMEREIAQLAGLGWRGKNTLLLHRTRGSYFFLACVLTDIELPSSQPMATAHCGTCTACLQACPTDAFVRPGVLDASRCISYLTIEHRGAIDVALRPGIGEWVFGCDVCQEVCPWNRKPARRDDRPVQPMETLDLVELFSLTDDQFHARYRKSPLWRTRRRGMLRNAAIVIGNQKHAASVPALSTGLADEDPVVRGAAAWALGQIGTGEAIEHLRDRLAMEKDPDVIIEVTAALA
ncbi:Epoxyqueuosine reductase [Rubripirellula tenax]|uniref:Epoxyqueuosine reductase n=1 Tax=Rubripirellula tenax TaxID=2528015 RepID=A0A5C6ECB7_9BACT|nr:tRNA epoxyqueuosine(34) reductase QueG [Rubripirellula tenax]TWU47433.1 Epoxyqueuosine reductase [Rubripirellula tenax]